MFSVFFLKKIKKSFEKGVDKCVVMVYNVVTKTKKDEVYVMYHFAICKLKNEEYECIDVHRYSLVAKGNTGRLDYKATIDKTIKQLEKDNETRKEQYKIVQFVDFVEHGNGYGASAHSKWAKECCEDAKKASFPIYDFEHPENGVEYY